MTAQVTCIYTSKCWGQKQNKQKNKKKPLKTFSHMACLSVQEVRLVAKKERRKERK